MMARMVAWWKRCVTRRFLILFELSVMSAIAIGILVATR